MANQITLTEEQLKNGVAVMADAIRVGEAGTRGDYTEIGLLVHLFEVLDIKVVLPRDEG